jgi:hypothetical protein
MPEADRVMELPRTPDEMGVGGRSSAGVEGQVGRGFRTVVEPRRPDRRAIETDPRPDVPSETPVNHLAAQGLCLC